MTNNLKSIILSFLLMVNIQNYNSDFDLTFQEKKIVEGIETKFGGKVDVKQQRVNHEPAELHHKFKIAIQKKNEFINYLKENESTFKSLHTQVSTDSIVNMIRTECISSEILNTNINDIPRIDENIARINYDEQIFQNLCKFFHFANKANCELLFSIQNTVLIASEKFGHTGEDFNSLLTNLINSENENSDPDLFTANSIFKITANNVSRQAFFNLWVNTGYLLKTMNDAQLPNLLYRNENVGLNNNKNMRHLSSLYQSLCYKGIQELLALASNAKLFYMVQTYETGNLDYVNWNQEWISYIPQYVQSIPGDRYSQNIHFPGFNNIQGSEYDFYVQRKSNYGIIAGFGLDLLIDGVTAELSKDTVVLNCFSFSNYRKIEMCNFGSDKNKIILI